jgi:hypothetical protein
MLGNEGFNKSSWQLLMAARDDDSSRIQTLLSVPDMQFYVKYTDRNVFVLPPRLVESLLNKLAWLPDHQRTQPKGRTRCPPLL